MNKLEIITLVIILLLSFFSFYIGNKQRKEKGFLFNNSYIYASKVERAEMNKKPHYKQSSIVFTILGSMFIFVFMEIIFKSSLLFKVVIFHVIAVVIYAIVSSISISRNEKK